MGAAQRLLHAAHYRVRALIPAALSAEKNTAEMAVKKMYLIIYWNFPPVPFYDIYWSAFVKIISAFCIFWDEADKLIALSGAFGMPRRGTVSYVLAHFFIGDDMTLFQTVASHANATE